MPVNVIELPYEPVGPSVGWLVIISLKGWKFLFRCSYLSQLEFDTYALYLYHLKSMFTINTIAKL